LDIEETVVIGIGNTLMSDDGIGVYVVRALEGCVPDGVELVEGSVYCADLLPALEGRKNAIFIDGIDAGCEPGAVFKFNAEEIKERKPSIPLSLHDFGVYELLTAAELIDARPANVILICVQVKDTNVGLELSKELAHVVPRVCDLVLKELSDLE